MIPFSPISDWSPAGKFYKSSYNSQFWRTSRYFLFSNSFPNRILSLILIFYIHGYYCTKLIVPFNFIGDSLISNFKFIFINSSIFLSFSGFSIYIKSPINVYSKLDFPEPTSPIMQISSPFFTFIFMFYKVNYSYF